MKMMRQRKSWIVLLAILALFAGCKGESPTAPPPGGGTSGGGGTPPPTGVSIAIGVSNANPLVDSTVVITATVTQNGQPVANGTAVEFETTNGTFSDTNSAGTIRTTTNGVATATLTSSTAGPARVTVTVNNVVRTTDVTFQARPVTPPPTSSSPTITSVTPAILNPAGGQIVHITGSHFTAPVRVLFDVGLASPLEGFVQNVTDTTIDVVSPGVNVGAAQQLAATVTVITQAGSASEQSVSAVNAVTFRNEVLTPVVSTVSPNSGPVTGGTRVTIFGDGFQAPVQVLFGSAEARVVNVDFHQIIVEAPSGRDTNPNGSGTVTGPVDVTVVNINSNTRVTSSAAFRYVNAMQITAVSPTIGSALGGTDITIDGTGFLAPVVVTVGGVQAQVIRVSGSQILARTAGLPSPCADQANAQIYVTNVNNGDFDVFGDAPNETGFTFVAVSPQITTVSPTAVTAGSNITATVTNPGVGALGTANVTFKVNGTTVSVSPNTITNGTTTTNFTVATPTSGYTFPTQACTSGSLTGTQSLPIDVPVIFTNSTTGCTATSTVTINPPNTSCVIPPPQAVLVSPSSGTCVTATTTAGTPVTVSNAVQFKNGAPAGGQSLVITAGSPTDPSFTVNQPTLTLLPQQTGSFSVTFDRATAGTTNANVTFTTNDPSNLTIPPVCLTGTANP